LLFIFPNIAEAVSFAASSTQNSDSTSQQAVVLTIVSLVLIIPAATYYGFHSQDSDEGNEGDKKQSKSWDVQIESAKFKATSGASETISGKLVEIAALTERNEIENAIRIYHEISGKLKPRETVYALRHILGKKDSELDLLREYTFAFLALGDFEEPVKLYELYLDAFIGELPEPDLDIEATLKIDFSCVLTAIARRKGGEAGDKYFERASNLLRGIADRVGGNAKVSALFNLSTIYWDISERDYYRL